MQDLLYTNDGSATLFSHQFNESYNSILCGALSESYEKHVKPVFSQRQRFNERIKILDVCFGLGYNTFAALLYAKKLGICIDITSPEIDENLPNKLLNFTFPQEFNELKCVIKDLADKGESSFCGSTIKIVFGDFRKTIHTIENQFDAVFQDPFSLRNNHLLWSFEYFCELYSKMSNFGILTTYSRSSAVRLTLNEAGFFVYELTLNAPIRSGTIASIAKLNEYQEIDIAKKKLLNPKLKIITDIL